LADDNQVSRVYRDGMGQWLRDGRHRDWIVAAVLAAASLLQLSLTPGPVHQQVLGALFAVVACATVGFRQRYPAAAGVTAQGLLALDFLTWHNLAAGGWTIAWFCSLYGLAVWSSRWRFAAGAAFVGLTDLLPVGRDADPSHWNSTAVGFALGTVVAMLLLRRIVGDRDTRARLAERERDVAAREAVVGERARIARELHDAVAHSVSMIVIQAGAERRVLGEDSGSTREVLQTIEQIGRDALTEMRRLVGMLRTDSADRLTPQPTLADLPTLMTQVGEAGLPVEFRVDGERRELPVGIELSAYRIVQEALTNALKHAGRAHACVSVRYGPDSLELEIADDGAGVRGGRAEVPSGGHGLVGIRERVTLYGGTFDASARSSGGFAVRVLLPL
jgi:signal transduction histidine kinase